MTVMPVIVAALMKDHVHEGAAHERLVVLDAGSVLAAIRARGEHVPDQRCEHDRRDARNAGPRAMPRPDEPSNDQADGDAMQDHGQPERQSDRASGSKGGSFQERVQSQTGEAHDDREVVGVRFECV